MTMKREAKMDHKIQLDTARYAPDGLTGTRFASPARRGQKMTAAEYIRYWMGRKPSNGMAQERKLTKQGFRVTESGRLVRTTRRK